MKSNQNAIDREGIKRNLAHHIYHWWTVLGAAAGVGLSALIIFQVAIRIHFPYISPTVDRIIAYTTQPEVLKGALAALFFSLLAQSLRLFNQMTGIVEERTADLLNVPMGWLAAMFLGLVSTLWIGSLMAPNASAGQPLLYLLLAMMAVSWFLLPVAVSFFVDSLKNTKHKNRAYGAVCALVMVATCIWALVVEFTFFTVLQAFVGFSLLVITNLRARNRSMAQ